MSWPELASWWLGELESDPAYEQVITPLLFEVFEPVPGHRYLDLGSGDGRLVRAVVDRGAEALGLDVNEQLAAVSNMPTAVARLPQIPFADDSFNGVYCVLTIEHIPDHRGQFLEAARVVRPGGVFALVANHPIWTAPGSTPITDADGEVLWRSGDYFSDGTSEFPTGEGTVVFHHRTMAELVNAAADAGWILEQVMERPHHEFDDQEGIPRLLACGWRLG